MQNLKSSIVHAVMAGHGEHTACGWFIGGSKVGLKSKLGGTKNLPDLVGLPWFSLCEKCLLVERTAARSVQGADTGHESASE